MNALERKMRKLTDDELMRHCTCYDHCCAACVEGDRRYEQKLRDEARAEERAAIVAYGKEYADQPHPIEADTELFSPECRGVLLGFLAAIERGDYRRGKP